MPLDRDFDHKADQFNDTRFNEIYADLVNDCAELVEIIQAYRLGGYSKAEMADLIATKVADLEEQAHDLLADERAGK